MGRNMSRKSLEHQLAVAAGFIFSVAYILVASKILLLHQSHNSNESNNHPPRHRHSRITATPHSSLESEKRVWTLTKQHLTPVEAETLSSVDYMACCGAGHRTSKLAEANYLAKLLGFTLRVYWGYCDTYETRQGQTEVFHYLFGAHPLGLNDDFIKVLSTRRNLFARINNDVPGFSKLIRDDRPCEEKCNVQKAEADVLFYLQLRDRFRARAVVQQFRKDHFDEKIVIGLHIRAGNGESGDFLDRNRNIVDLPSWLQSLAVLIQTNHLHTGTILQGQQKSVVVFLATDTQSLETQLKSVLPNVEIVVWSQQRPSVGSGVLFGEQGKVNVAGEACLNHWEDTFMDMILLSYSDVLIAARPSSFTQGLPMSLTLSQNKTFCEVNLDATDMQCYSSFIDWCCNGRSSFSLEGIKQRYEYLRIPNTGINTSINLDSNDDRKRFKIEERPPNGCEPRPIGWKQTCLPFDWAAHVVKPRQTTNQQA